MSKRIILAFVLLSMVIGLAGMSATAAIDLSGLASFLYEGNSYVPLKSTASFLGAPLQWDADTGRAVMTYNGQDLALTPNSRNAFYQGRPVTLASPSIVVDGVTYVPVNTFKRFYDVPVEWDRSKSQMKIKGPGGWKTINSSSRSSWHGGPPSWAPAWGRRGNGAPGHPSNIKANGSGKAKAWGQHGYGASVYPNNAKPGVNVRAKAWGPGPRSHGAPGHQSGDRANGKAKTKGNKRDR